MKNRWVGHVARIPEMRNVHKILIWKPQGKNTLGRHVVDGRIISLYKVNLKELWNEDVDWIHLAQDRDKLL
jgi:hypothetical protein